MSGRPLACGAASPPLAAENTAALESRSVDPLPLIPDVN